jgi:hypothetical protein
MNNFRSQVIALQGDFYLGAYYNFTRQDITFEEDL